jgi:CheY-like chemotaxis protein
MKQSGGHAKIYSEVGRGTTVKLYLPRQLAEAGAPTSRGAQAESELARGRAEETILVVEDEREVRAVAVEALGELGYSVVEAEDGPAALRLLEQGARVDLVFTDVVMPGMTGRELADQVKGRWPDIRILFTTGYTRNAIVHGGRLDPGVHLLPKPYTSAALSRKVRAVLDE